MILLDTNILVRLSDSADPQYKATQICVAECWRRSRRLCVSDQTLQEYWVVATRDASKNGLAMQAPRADRFLEVFARTFVHAPDPEVLFDGWRDLVNRQSLLGIRAYDARFAAFVQAGRFQGLMTYNLRHFAALGIAIVDPNDSSTWQRIHVALSSNHSRRSTINGVRYRRAVSPESGFLTVVVQSERGDGMRMLFPTEYREGRDASGHGRQQLQVIPQYVRNRAVERPADCNFGKA
jgi:predicted nucleic acid-binding protein